MKNNNPLRFYNIYSTNIFFKTMKQTTKYSLSIIPMMITCCLLLWALPATAQEERNTALVMGEKNGWEYEVFAGVNMGGASPLPLPKEIRKLEDYNPKFNGSIGATVTKWMDEQQKWGIVTGLFIEQKGMTTAAIVKNYHTSIVMDGSSVEGYWTGKVHTTYASSQVSVPLLAGFSPTPSVKLSAGIFGAYRFDGAFNGYVSDGYLREGNPTGNKVAFGPEERANYDFSSSLRRWKWGVRIGGSWLAYKHFSVVGHLSWEFTPIFTRDFKTIASPMYPIYLNVGFGYRF